MQYTSFQLFLILLHNVGLMALVVMAYSSALRHMPKSLTKGIVVGVLFGLAGMLSMADPIRTPEGLQLDARTVMATLAAPFGGLSAGLIAGCMMAAFRIWQGGAGVLTGIVAIAMASGMGYAFHLYWSRRTPTVGQLAVLSVAACSVLLSLFIMPSQVAIDAIRTAGLPLAANAIGGILLLGAFLAREDRHYVREQELKTEATTDALTSLANRRTFDRLAYRITSQAQERGASFAMLLVDVDRFKSINDRFGHQAGDRVLAEIARIVQAETRADDLVARYGGEEIAVLMPSTSLRVAERVAERVRGSVAGQAIRLDGEDIFVTVSIGVSGGQASPAIFPSVFKAADDALYEAKNNGRNRVELRLAA